MATPEQIRKLPAWARTELEKAEGRAKVAERRLADHQDAAGTTRVSYGDVWKNPRYLKDGYYDVVRFQIGDDRMRFIDFRLDKDKVEMSASTGVVLQPNASNTATIYLKDD